MIEISDKAAVWQLVYRSHSRDGAASALQMSDILSQARPLNARDGITGVLTVVDGTFVQIIEGTEAAVDDLLKRLLRDPRHSDVQVIDRRVSSRRLFADWDMVSPRLASDELAIVALLLQDEGARLADYGATLSRAVQRQDALLEGGRGPRDYLASQAVASVGAKPKS